MLLHGSLATSFVCACCLCGCFVKLEEVLAAVERSFQHRQSVHLIVKLFPYIQQIPSNVFYLQPSKVALRSRGVFRQVVRSSMFCSCCWRCHCYLISPCGWRLTNQWWWKIPCAKPQPITVPLLTAPGPCSPQPVVCHACDYAVKTD